MVYSVTLHQLQSLDSVKLFSNDERVGVVAGSSDPVLHYCDMRSYGLSETTKCHLPPDHDWNPGSAEYKPEMLRTKSRCSDFENKFNYPQRGWGVRSRPGESLPLPRFLATLRNVSETYKDSRPRWLPSQFAVDINTAKR